MNLKIDPFFESYIPPLTRDERIRLEENIVRAGVIYDPIKTWNGYIIDGHNRYYIAQEHPDVRYATTELFFENRDDVIVWICSNQLGRRNLTKAQKRYLIGKQYNLAKCANGGDRKSAAVKSDGKNYQVIPHDTTSQRIAKQHCISEKAVRLAARFTQGVDLAEETTPGIRSDILAGKLKPTQRCIDDIIQSQGEQRKMLVDALNAPNDIPKQTTGQNVPSEGNKDLNSDPVEIKNFYDLLPSDNISRESYLSAFRGSRGALKSIETDVPVSSQIDNLIYEMTDAAQTLIYRWTRIAMIYHTALGEEDAYAGITKIADNLDAFLWAERQNIRELKAVLQRKAETADRGQGG